MQTNVLHRFQPQIVAFMRSVSPPNGHYTNSIYSYSQIIMYKSSAVLRNYVSKHYKKHCYKCPPQPHLSTKRVNLKKPPNKY